MNNENNTTTIEDNAKINALNNSGDNMDTINSNSSSDIKPIQNTRYNIQNLRPYNKTDNVLSSEEAKRRGRNGAKKSAEVRKARKTMRDTIIDMLSQPLTSEMIEKYGLENVKPGDTMQEGILAAAFATAMSGDIKAAQYLRDTAGEQPTIKQDIRNEIVTKEDLQTIDNVKKLLTS